MKSNIRARAVSFSLVYTITLTLGWMSTQANGALTLTPHQWPTFRNGFLNQGRSPVAIREIQQKGSPVSFETQGLIWGTPVVDALGKIYFGSADKNLYALEKASNDSGKNRLVWSYTLFDRADSLIDSASAITQDGNALVIPGGDGFLHAVDLRSGQPKWTFEAKGASSDVHEQGTTVNSFEGNVQVGPDGTIYAGSDNGYMYALDPQTGALKWSFLTQMMIWSSPTVAQDNRWLAFGSLDGKFYLLNPQSGAEWDQVKLGGDIKSSPAQSKTGRLFVGSSAGKLHAFDVISHRRKTLQLNPVWEHATRGEVYSSPAVFKVNQQERVVFGSLDGDIHCLDAQTGKLIWTYRTGSRVAGSPIVSADQVVLVGAKNGKLYALDGITGQRLWSFQTQRSQLRSNLDSSPALDFDGWIHIGSYSGQAWSIPSGYCPKHRNDPRCEFGGTQDSSELPTGETSLAYIDLEGHLLQKPQQPISRVQTIAFKLVAYEKDEWIANAALLEKSLKLTDRLTGEEIDDFYVKVSSDLHHLYLVPKKPLAAGREWTIRVEGKWYRKSLNWLRDRFQSLSNQAFVTTLQFQTRDLSANELPFTGPKQIPAFGVRGLYVQHPEALDTYIPAAMDGQAFLLVSAPLPHSETDLLFLALPGYPTPDGQVKLAHEPSKVFALEGTRSGSSVTAQGRMKLAGMGGTIEFKGFRFSGEWEPAADMESDWKLGELQFFAYASCLSLQGNGSNYRFPGILINQVCGQTLQLRSIGQARAVGIVPDSDSVDGVLLSEIIYDLKKQKVIETRAHQLTVGAATDAFASIGTAPSVTQKSSARKLHLYFKNTTYIGSRLD